MHYKRSIIDVLKDVAPVIRDDQGRRLTLVEQCRRTVVAWSRQQSTLSGL